MAKTVMLTNRGLAESREQQEGGRVNISEKIIVAMDCDGQQARRLARQLQGTVSWLKVGMTLFYTEGPEIVREFKAQGFKVFVDLKLNDIPHQIKGAAQSIAATGADLFTVHASGGQQMMEAALSGVSAATKADSNTPKVIGITVLTSFDQDSLKTIGISKNLTEQVIDLAELAKVSGLAGVVCSPQETAILRQKLGQDAIIVTPGVRPADAATQDQQRVATPRAALEAGASYLVIGRPITEASDPKQAFLSIVASC